MHPEPISHDTSNPLISIVIHDYSVKYLRQLFETIFEQTVLDNIEVIYSDNSTTDGSWEIALEYSQKFPTLLALTRNIKNPGFIIDKYNVVTGHNINFMNLIKGKYYIPLSSEDAFLPEYLKNCAQRMESDPLAYFSMIRRKRTDPAPPPTIHKKHLVSITIHNYNYGRYLRQCFESVFAQTYENIEIIFSDNASTDDSWDIALEYAQKYPDKISVIRNRKNFGGDINFLNCREKVLGKYLLSLCSDDAILPDFIKKCVDALDAYPNAGYAMVHRTIIDENNNQSDEPSFYNQSCLIPGYEQAAVYMLAAVNPCMSQVMYNLNATIGKESKGGLGSRWYANRILDFNTCCEFDMVYIKEPLLMHRLHSQNDSFQASENLIEVIAPYVLQHQFAETASNYNLTNVTSRLPEAIKKLSNLCIRYCVRSLCSDNETAAQRYFHLAIAIMPAITSDSTFKILENYWKSDTSAKRNIIDSLTKADNLVTRSVSYDPPSGSVPLD